MKGQRDYIAEIISIKRRTSNYSSALLPQRMYSLQQAFKSRDNSNREVLKYFPIGLIACLEGICRASIKELIDHGSPYFDRVSSFKQVSFDFEVIQALQQKTISVGDFVAHLLPISSFALINSHLSTLLDDDFLARLKSVEGSWSGEPENESDRRLIKEPNKVFAGVQKTFELRHIYAHELASEEIVDPAVIGDCFESTKTFINAFIKLIADLIYPDAFLSNYEMKLKANEELEKSTEKMNKLYEQLSIRIKETFDSDPEYLLRFESSQRAWNDFAQQQTMFLTDLRFKGGTGHSLVYMLTMNDLTQNRILEFENILDDLNNL